MVSESFPALPSTTSPGSNRDDGPGRHDSTWLIGVALAGSVSLHDTRGPEPGQESLPPPPLTAPDAPEIESENAEPITFSIPATLSQPSPEADRAARLTITPSKPDAPAQPSPSSGGIAVAKLAVSPSAASEPPLSVSSLVPARSQSSPLPPASRSTPWP